MRIFQCNKCGCIIPEEKMLEKIEGLRKRGLVSKDTEREARKEIKKSYPYIGCHNQGCDGLLRKIEKDSVGAKIKDEENG